MFSPWVGKIPRGGQGTPLQYCRLENATDRRSLVGAPMGHREPDRTEAAEHDDCLPSPPAPMVF